MRTLGIIGGTSWHSTVEYYRHINASVNALYGNPTNPPLVLYNLSQAGIHSLQTAGAWDRVADIYYATASRLQAAGCEGLLLAANTAHKVFDDLVARVDLPVLHIADAIGKASKSLGTVGLIGTLFTMEHDFISRRLLERHGVQTLTPASAAARVRLHDIIQQELSLGRFELESKRFILEEIALLQARGAKGIVLGCTELPLIIDQTDVALPVLDTTLLHSRLAVDFILGKELTWKRAEIGCQPVLGG